MKKNSFQLRTLSACPLKKTGRRKASHTPPDPTDSPPWACAIGDQPSCHWHLHKLNH